MFCEFIHVWHSYNHLQPTKNLDLHASMHHPNGIGGDGARLFILDFNKSWDVMAYTLESMG